MNSQLGISKAVYEDLREFLANKPQAMAYTIMPNEMYAFWGRGTGKTVGLIAPWILHKAQVMPRSNGGLIGASFAMIKDRILPNIFAGFQQLGLEKDIDYCFGKRPPESWDKPLTPIITFDNVLTFPNGTTMELISLQIKGSANGKSLQWIVADEAKFLNETRLQEEVFPILRGHVRHFGASPWYGAKLFVTDKLSTNIYWLLEKRKLVDQDLVQTVLRYQLELNGLRLSLADANESSAKTIYAKIRKLDSTLNVLRKNMVYVTEAKSMDNLANLSPSFFTNMKRSLKDYAYKISIDNEDPTRVENTYYPDRNEHHLYVDIDNDDDKTKPIGVVLDYQASISPLVSFQVSEQVRGYKTLNILSAIHELYPLGLEEVVNAFCQEHIDRPCKEVIYFYDHTAVGRQNDSKSFDGRITEYFEKNNWNVMRVYMGSAPEKDIQYEAIRAALKHEDKNKPQILFNELKCTTMLMAIDLTETKVSSTGKLTKNKYNETQFKTYPQELATHYPDCFDQIIDGVITKDLYPSSTISNTGLNGFRNR